MAGAKYKNFEFSSDILKLSEGDFKALLKSRYGLRVKEIKEIYNAIHGNSTTTSKESGESEEQRPASEDIVSGDETISEHTSKPTEEEA